MKKKLSIMFALVLVISLLLVPATVSADPVEDVLWGVTGVNLYGPTEYSQVFKVNTATGVVTIVRDDTGDPMYQDIAMTPNGNLYAIGRITDDTNFRDFFRLDPTTGEVLDTVVGFLPGTVDGYWVNSLAAESNTTLLAIEGGGVAVGETDPKTPFKTVERPTALLRITLDENGDYDHYKIVGLLPVDYADGDLDKDPTTGKWYGAFWGLTTPGDNSSELWEIDVEDPSLSTFVSHSGVQWIDGLVFSPSGVAYAGSYNDLTLYTVNVDGGGSSVLHNLDATGLLGVIDGLSSAWSAEQSRGAVGLNVNVPDIVAISVSPSSIDFGTVLPGQTVNGNNIYVKNIGTHEVDVNASIPTGTVLQYLELLKGDWSGRNWDNIITNLAMGQIAPAIATRLPVPAGSIPSGPEGATLLFIARAS